MKDPHIKELGREKVWLGLRGILVGGFGCKCIHNHKTETLTRIRIQIIENNAITFVILKLNDLAIFNAKLCADRVRPHITKHLPIFKSVSFALFLLICSLEPLLFLFVASCQRNFHFKSILFVFVICINMTTMDYGKRRKPIYRTVPGHQLMRIIQVHTRTKTSKYFNNSCLMQTHANTEKIKDSHFFVNRSLLCYVYALVSRSDEFDTKTVFNHKRDRNHNKKKPIEKKAVKKPIRITSKIIEPKQYEKKECMLCAHENGT